VVVATAAPAARTPSAAEHATNYRTRVLSLSPAVAGIALRPIEHGDRLQLRNTTDHDVVVLGYDDEPYCASARAACSRTERSPATYVNRTRLGTDRPPAARRLRRHLRSGGASAADHRALALTIRAHWMSNDPPPGSATRADGAPPHPALHDRPAYQRRGAPGPR
jgi:hypothetical protein